MSSTDKITRVTIEATEETVAEALSQDLAGRSSDLVSFVSLLDRVDGNYSIFLDAPWGMGKTFFVKEAATILRDGNELTRTELGAGVKLAEKAQFENLHLPVYFNAWESDYRDAPVASLIETLVDEFVELRGDDTMEAELKDAGRSAINAIEISLGPVHLKPGELASGTASENLTAPLRRDRNTRSRVFLMLDKVVAERAERIVLFVDELDRCRPTYAVRLLEAIKFLFDHERLTVVFAVDFPMLAEAVRGCYGSGFDGEAYLSRFYDMYFRLPDMTPAGKMMLDGYWKRGDSLLWKTARSVVERGEMNLRDQLKFTSILMHYVMDGAANESQARDASIYVRNVVGPLMLCCRFCDPPLLRGFLAGEIEAFEGFWRKFEGVQPFSKTTASLCQYASGSGVESRETSASTFSSYICPALLGTGSGESDARVLDSSMGNAKDEFREVLRKLHIG